VERLCTHARLFPGTEVEYDLRLSAMDPSVADAIRDAGIRNLTIFRRGTDVWQYGESKPDTTTATRLLATSVAYRAWKHSLRNVVAPVAYDSDRTVRYARIFSADRPAPGGPMSRGLLALVIDPERAAEYDARHADAWPEMLDALEASGFRNYHGFRLGAGVVYYGEYYPDMATAFRTIGSLDVNGRWADSFTGIITTITEPDGKLITADEVFHQD
jgi:L-rhamnose mutarotase